MKHMYIQNIQVISTKAVPHLIAVGYVFAQELWMSIIQQNI